MNSKLGLFGIPRRLNYVKRCSLFPLVNPCSVAEHSFQTAVLGYYWALELDKLGVKVDVNKVVTQALLHDLEESVTSDIPFHVKKSLRSQLPLFDEALELMVTTSLVPKSSELTKMATGSCDGSLEWLMIKTCDMAELLYYCHEEYLSGNRHLGEVTRNAIEFIATLLKKIQVLLLEQSEEKYVLSTETRFMEELYLLLGQAEYTLERR